MKIKQHIAQWVLYVLALRAMLEALYDLYFACTDDAMWRPGYFGYAALMATIAVALFVWGELIRRNIRT